MAQINFRVKPVLTKALSALLGAIICHPLAALSSSDLNVTYVERTPRYTMYKWCYDKGYSGHTNPHLCPGSPINATRHYPRSGDVVTFTAHIKNCGDASSGPFDYRWLFDGQTVSSGTYRVGLAAGCERTLRWQWKWDGREHDLEFRVDPDNLITEECEINNAVKEPVLALAFYFVFGREFYDALSSLENPYGSHSADDWLRFQIDGMNNALADSIHPLTPQGCLERIRIDRIAVLPNSSVRSEITRGKMPLESWKFDGRWGFYTFATARGQIRRDAEKYARKHISDVDWGLVHELGHQLGLIDIYKLVVQPNTNLVRDIQGRPYNLGYWTRSMPYIMGSPSKKKIFSEHSACYLNRKLHERTGAFGYYLWDIPSKNKLRVLDVLGKPLPKARLKIYQSQRRSRLSNLPTFAGYTDKKGVFSLGGQPFGTEINNWGTNGLLFIVIEAYGQRETAWLEIIDFNLAYWAGHTDEAWYDVRSGIAPQLADPTNIALGKAAVASSSRPGYSPGYALDGNLHTAERAWSPAGPGEEAWWQVDLGAVYPVYKVSVYGHPKRRPSWFQQFHIEVSVTGAFNGEEVTVAVENDWNKARIPKRYPVSYNFPPAKARYVRVVADGKSHGQLQEFEVFRVLESGPPPPPPIRERRSPV